MDLVYRVSRAAVADVLASMGTQGYDAVVSPQIVGRDQRAVTVREVDDDELSAVDTLMLIVDVTSRRVE